MLLVSYKSREEVREEVGTEWCYITQLNEGGAMMHEETRLCHEHGCPDHGRRETEWMEVNPDYWHVKLYYQVNHERIWNPMHEDIEFTYCIVEMHHRYTHHLCKEHDVILINKRYES